MLTMQESFNQRCAVITFLLSTNNVLDQGMPTKLLLHAGQSQLSVLWV
jgi:hypothetical protein